ncbi:MAG: addiction module protein [Deltaproteobacteria bacterium]|nr:addiction module protein [Nannocystaceae bacterium]
MGAPIEPPPGFDDLPIEEKVAYVQALWDLIATKPEELSVPSWHRAVIAERLAEARSDDPDTKSWSEVRDEVRARLQLVRP